MTARQSNILAMTGAVLLFIGLALQFVKLVFAPYVYLAGYPVCLCAGTFRL